jgi:signal transduction histidine kinase
MLLSHIEDILDFARLDAGVLKLNPTAIDVRIAVARVLRLMRPIAGERGIKVRANIPKDLPAVQMDARAFEQIMINLTANAIIHSRPHTHVLIQAEPAGNMVSTTITDQGEGIPQGELERIFEPFYQSGDARLARASGTGLGLAIVKNLVDKSGGDITITSTVGEGAVVTVTMPRADVGED